MDSSVWYETIRTGLSFRCSNIYVTAVLVSEVLLQKSLSVLFTIWVFGGVTSL